MVLLCTTAVRMRVKNQHPTQRSLSLLIIIIIIIIMVNIIMLLFAEDKGMIGAYSSVTQSTAQFYIRSNHRGSTGPAEYFPEQLTSQYGRQ